MRERGARGWRGCGQSEASIRGSDQSEAALDSIKIKESHNQFISIRSHKVTWRDSQNTEHRTSTHLPLLVNQSELEAWSRKIQTLTNTLVIRDKVIHKWVPEMAQIISWTAFQASKFHFKKFQSMKICKSLVRIQNSTDTVRSLYMASETPR